MLRGADVVGMTTTGVAMNQAIVEALGARIIVVEEAAEVKGVEQSRVNWYACHDWSGARAVIISASGVVRLAPVYLR